MISVFASILLYEFVCRQYCDVDTDTCRSRRKKILSWVSGFSTLLMIRAKYLEALRLEIIAAWEKEREEKIKQAKETLIPAG